MADVKKCGICRRSSLMTAEEPDGGMCVECQISFSEHWNDPKANPVTSALWAAKRAWEFADAMTDATSFVHRPGESRAQPHPAARSEEVVAKRFLESAAGIDSDALSTPPEIWKPLLELWDGTIDCDPCTNDHATVPATHKYTWGGLHRPWFAKTYENHPYSTNLPWIDKAIYEMDKVKRVRELLILCMTSTSTEWWNRAMYKPKRNPIVMCTKRIKFLGLDGKPMKHTAQFDTSLIYYGSRAAKFRKLFRHVERWTTKGRL